MPQHTINEGFNPNTGVQTKTHFEDGDIIVQKTFDAEPHLDYARQMREATEGQRWGEGKIVGTIPPAIYAQALVIRDPQERKKFVQGWLRDNPAFVTFDKYLKG